MTDTKSLRWCPRCEGAKPPTSAVCAACAIALEAERNITKGRAVRPTYATKRSTP